MLYNVKISTELMVVANSDVIAIEIAKKNAPNEIATYGNGHATVVRNESDIPEDWKNIIPYSKDSKETKKCSELVAIPDSPKEIRNEDMEELIRIKNSTKGSTVAQPFVEVKPESRPDPKPKDLDWHETKSGRPMKQLRFVR